MTNPAAVPRAVFVLCLIVGVGARAFPEDVKPAVSAPGAVDYNRDVRPILAETCYLGTSADRG